MRLLTSTALIRAGLVALVFCLVSTTIQAQDQTAPAEPSEVASDTVAAEQPDEAAIAAEKQADDPGVIGRINQSLEPVDALFGKLNKAIGGIIFFPIPLQAEQPDGSRQSIPAAVLLLVLGAAYFTIRMGFISIRAFGHAIAITAGRYDSKNVTGDVSHFQALTTALSATVGLGNIAGVTAAIALGGPGAAFWMIVAGFLGMSSKFVECTLGQKYREVRPDGRIMGGAMYYLSRGLAEQNMAPFGKILAIAFAVLCIGGSFAGGNAYQVNGSLDAIRATWPELEDFRWLYGLVMVALTAVVIIGGIRRIASTADKIVPFMCGVYVLAGIIILLKNATAVPAAFSTIINMAFTTDAARGGIFGVLVWGFKRAAFSNEAGVGSAAIAHAAAKTAYPIREGLVALLEPFIDTIIVCTMTALVIVVTGAWDYSNPNINPNFIQHYTVENGVVEKIQGAALTSAAMDSQIPGFRYVLAVATFLFAYSTMISWSYYGERCWSWLFGESLSHVYRGIFLVFTFLGSIISATEVMEFGDLMIFGMMIPNMLGLVLLSGGVARDLKSYWEKLRSGEFNGELQEQVTVAED